MRFQYTEKKVNLPENVHKYAEKKVMKLERFFGDDAEALVTFSVDKDRNIAEITVHASNMYFRARESTSDMFASIDAAVATMERQIRKNKTRLSRRLRQWERSGERGARAAGGRENAPGRLRLGAGLTRRPGAAIMNIEKGAATSG